MQIHTLFDILALLVGFGVSRFIQPTTPMISDEELRYRYYIVLILGVSVGAFGIGTLNVLFSNESLGIGKSVFGALFGGIVCAEIFKKYKNIKGSTGAYFVPSLAIGIAIGRIGCYLSGMEDFTYGIVTSMPWGHDFGDGLLRHPVQLYESFAMASFFIYSIYLYKFNNNSFKKDIFYRFISFYALQRFIWEFLKPYESIIMGVNIFQIGCILLMVYAFYMMNKKLT